jgi:HlyD family secretion protein
MRLFLKLLLAFVLIAISAWTGLKPAKNYWYERNRPKWETAAVVREDAKRVINSTGKIQPVLEISVGSFVSGPITELNVDFNDFVKKGEILAKVDPKLYQAAVDRDTATLNTRLAEVDRVNAQLNQAKNNLARGERLREKNDKYLSDREMDVLNFECQGLEASLKIAEASVIQAQANLKNSATNLEYTEIRAPLAGFILQRNIGPGQTLASQFQVLELFKLAPDLREKMHVFASVDEADIGLIRKAYEKKLPVTFTVEAQPNEIFEGEIEQVRYSATELQNVITYPVVVAAKNPDLKLLPKMTALISFEVDSVSDVLKVPSAALRFFPENLAYVREEDRKLLDGSQWAGEKKPEGGEQQAQEATLLSAKEKVEKAKTSSRRHVWIEKDGLLQAIEVKIGFAENRFTYVESEELTEGMQLVTGQKKK